MVLAPALPPPALPGLLEALLVAAPRVALASSAREGEVVREEEREGEGEVVVVKVEETEGEADVEVAADGRGGVEGGDLAIVEEAAASSQSSPHPSSPSQPAADAALPSNQFHPQSAEVSSERSGRHSQVVASRLRSGGTAHTTRCS